MTSTLVDVIDLTATDAPQVSAEFVRGEGVVARDIMVNQTRVTSCIPAGNASNDLLNWWQGYWSGHRPYADTTRGSLRIMELFAGAGGLALGFGQAAAELGYDVESVIAVDQDSEALDVYARHNRTEHALARSVSELVDYRIKGNGESATFRYEPTALGAAVKSVAGTIDVLLAGPPCQGHSDLNNHTRGTDRRNELYLTVPALAVALDVPTIIIENVPGIVRDSRGVVATTLKLLTDAGYQITAGTLRADELGWPQRRRRFFVVATRDFAPIDLKTVATGLAQPAITVEQALEGFVAPAPDSHMWRQAEVSPETRARLDWLFDNDAYDLDLSERPDCHRDGTTYVSVYGRMRPDEPSPTITTGFMTMGRGRFVHPFERRMVTPAEAARLQGFPDNYDFTLADQTPPSTLKLTKWIGDAVPMPLGHAATLSALLPRALP